jgi:anti-sigma factor RsiW
MDRTELLQLMHAALDGAASSEERATLDRVLAQDPRARAQFAELERLFGVLDGMPRVEPPEGFADDVMAALQRSKTKWTATRQPFAQSGVIGPTGSDIRVRAPSKPITARTPSGPIRGRQDMSKRGIWIMSGVAAAVLALFVGTSVDFPASGDKAAGTIVPAERVRNAQPSAADVKLVEPSRTPSPGVPLATGNTNLGAGGNSNLGAGGNSNLGAGGNSNLGAGGNSNLGAGGNSNLGAGGNSNLGAGGNSNLGAGGNSNLGAAGNSNLGAGGSSNLGGGGNSNLGVAGKSNLGGGGNSNLGSGVAK